MKSNSLKTVPLMSAIRNTSGLNLHKMKNDLPAVFSIVKEMGLLGCLEFYNCKELAMGYLLGLGPVGPVSRKSRELFGLEAKI